MELLIKFALLQEREDEDPPAQERLAILALRGWRENLVDIVVVVHREPDLFQMVDRDRPSPSLLRTTNEQWKNRCQGPFIHQDRDAMTLHLGRHSLEPPVDAGDH